MSDEPNSDAVDILSELENDAKNTNNEPEEQVTSVPEESTNSESEKILQEASAVAEQQSGDKFPSIPNEVSQASQSRFM